MKRFATVCVATLLLGGFVAIDVAEAQRPRSTAQRRLRPGHGYWESTPKTNYKSINYNWFQRNHAPSQVNGR